MSRFVSRLSARIRVSPTRPVACLEIPHLNKCYVIRVILVRSVSNGPTSGIRALGSIRITTEVVVCVCCLVKRLLKNFLGCFKNLRLLGVDR